MRKLLILLSVFFLASCATVTPPKLAPTPPEPVYEVPMPRNVLILPIYKNNSANRYAVIIGGMGDQHTGNVAVAYQSLLANRYLPERIFILAEGGEQSPWYVWTDHPTYGNVRILLRDLREAVDENDSILIYLTGTGVKHGIHYSVQLNPEEVMSRSMFLGLLEEIKPKLGLFVTDVDYWESFEGLPCTWVQATAVSAGEELKNKNFGRVFWRMYAKNLITAYQALMKASIQNPENTSTMKRCYVPPKNPHARKGTRTPA